MTERARRAGLEIDKKEEEERKVDHTNRRRSGIDTARSVVESF